MAFKTKTSALTVALVLASGGAWLQPALGAELTQPARFDIQSRSLDAALLEFSRQAGIQIFGPSKSLSGKKSPVLKGEIVVEQALQLLLKDSGLTYRTVNSKTVAIGPVGEEKAWAASSEPIHMARVDEVTAASPRDGQGKATGVEQTTARSGSAAQAGEDIKGVPEILVSGQRSINLDVQRSRDDVQPYVVFDSAQIQSSQASNLEDFLQSRLPMVSNTGTASLALSTPTSKIDLRGLGSEETLILLDGRRLPARSNGDSFSFQPDINGIPLSMVERIEVLPSTASGIYGGTANGGVINIITRKDFSGAILGVNYVNTFDTDTAQRRADLTASHTFLGGATALTLTASYADANELLTQDRDFNIRALRQVYANDPALIEESFFVPNGYTTNIHSADGSALVLKDGTALNSQSTFVPLGYQGPASDGGRALVANAGRYNLELPDDLSGRRSSLYTNPSPVSSLGLSLRQKVSPWLEAYADYLTTRVMGRNPYYSVPNSAYLAADAPNNPFDNDLLIAFPNPGLTATVDSYSVSNTERITGGLLARLPGQWQGGVDHVWTRSRSKRHTDQPNFNLPGSADFRFSTAVALGELDVLRDLNARPFDYAPYYTRVVFDARYNFTSLSTTARASGPLFRLPAGPVILSASAEWKQDSKDANLYPATGSTGNGVRYFWSPEISADYGSLYAETRMPLLAAANTRSARLELQLAARHDRADLHPLAASSSAFVLVPGPDGPFPAAARATRRLSDTSYTAGLRYTPWEDLTLRASFGTGFLPPALASLAASQPVTRSYTLTDPKRGGVTATLPVVVVSGGNLNLRPEQSESVSAGIIFTPRQAPGLRLSVDYTRIRKTDEIGSLLPQQIVSSETMFPGRVTRAALTSADQALGYSGGVITQIDVTTLNFARREVEAVDFQLDYTLNTRWGEMRPYAMATWTRHFDFQTTLGSPVFNAAGFADGPMKWRGNGGIDWRRGAWSGGWNMQYYDSTAIYGSSEDPVNVAGFVRTMGFDRYPRQLYHDLQARYQFAARERGWLQWLSNTEVSLGLRNVFNKEPPLFASEYGASYTPTTDPRLRRYSIDLRRQF